MAIKKPELSGGRSGLDLFILALLLAAIVPVVINFFSFTLDPLGLALKARDYLAPILERNLWWLQNLSLILSALFLWGIIYIFIRTNYLEIKRERFLDILGKGYVSRRRAIKGWRQIQKRLWSREQNQWKLAILEADHILNEILKMSGYLGPNLEEKLELITSAQLTNVEDVKRVHQIRHKIASDPSFEISFEETKEIIGIYKESFKELNLIQG